MLPNSFNLGRWGDPAIVDITFQQYSCSSNRTRKIRIERPDDKGSIDGMRPVKAAPHSQDPFLMFGILDLPVGSADHSGVFDVAFNQRGHIFENPFRY